MRRRILFLFLACLIAGGFIFRESILSHSFQWYLKGYCHACFGARLTYEKIEHREGLWVIDHPTLSTKKGLEQGGFRFEAKQASLNVSIDWISRLIDFSISLDEPHADIGKEAQELKKIFQRSCKEFRLFRVHTNFSVPRGSFLVHSFNQDNAIPCFFSLDIACKDSSAGDAAFWFEGMSKGAAGVDISLWETEKNEPRFLFDFHGLDLEFIHRIVKEIWPSCTFCTSAEGFLDGKITVDLPKGEEAYAEGELTLRHFVMAHKDYQYQFSLPEVTLQVAPAHSKISEQSAVHTLGFLELSKDASLIIFKEGNPFWRLDSINGMLSFKTGDLAKFEITGICSSENKKRPLHIEGHLGSVSEGQNSLHLGLHLQGREGCNDMTAHFSVRKLAEEWNCAEMEFSGISQEEIAFVQHTIGYVYPQWKQIQIFDGSFDAALLVYLKDLQVAEVKIERFIAHQLKFAFLPWDLYGDVTDASGWLSFDLSAINIIKTFNSDLKVINGSLSFAGLDEGKWQFSGVHTHLSVKEGVIQKSLLQGDLAGLKGEIEIDGTRTGESLISIELSGEATDVAKVLPAAARQGIEKTFYGDYLKVTALASTYPQGLNFKGKVLITEKEGQVNEASFGFALENSSQALWGCWPPHRMVSDYYADAGLKVVNVLMPTCARPAAEVYERLLKHHLGVSGIVIKDGWFEACHLPLGKYVSPFIFQQNQMVLNGYGDFKGTFDEQGIYVCYDGQEMVLENDDFTIEIKNLFKGNLDEDHYVATHAFDIEKMRSFGSIPISGGTYFEKNSGLLFTDFSTHIYLEDAKAHVTDAETYCNGVYFAGDIDIDWSMPGKGVFEIDLRTQEMHGRVSQLQDLFSHFDHSLFFMKIPMEGELAFRKKGGHIHFFFQENDYHVQTKIEGAMTDGKLACSNADTTLQDLNMNFEYDHEANTLEFSEIQATLLVGPPNHVEEYSVAGEYLRFTNYMENIAEFDLWVGDKKRDIIRLVGNTLPVIDENTEKVRIGVELDHTLSHFGGVRPEVFQLQLKDWSQIDLFHLEFDFQLKGLLSDLQRFSRTGFFFLSRGLLKGLNEVKLAEGYFKADLTYDGERSLFSYRVAGNDVTFEGRHFNRFLLSGSKKESVWIVDQLQLDEISVAFDILKEAGVWNINFLGARIGQSLLLGLEGKYLSEASQLSAKINLLEVNLALLKEWPSLEKLITDLRLAGHLKAIGDINMVFDRSSFYGVNIDINIVGSINRGEVKGLHLQDIENVSFHYSSEKGLALSNIQTALKTAKADISQASLFLEKINYDFPKQEFAVYGLHFRIPAANLAWLAENLQQSFPSAMTQPLADVIRDVKTDGEIKGSLGLNLSENYCALRLALADGVYRFMGTDHSVRHFVLDCDPSVLKVSAEYDYNHHCMKLEARCNAPGFDTGEIVLADSSEKDGYPLTCGWRIDPQQGFFIEKVEGSLSGIRCYLVKDPSCSLSEQRMVLIGRVDLDLRKARMLLEDKAAEQVANWGFGAGYALQGSWTINKDDESSFINRLSFQGDLLGSDFEFNGYQFFNLSAQLNYTPELIRLFQVSIADTSGSLHANEVTFFYQQGEWKTNVPSLLIGEFRPSLMRLAGSSPSPLRKTLVVRQLEINELSGTLGNRNSFMCSGRLTFASPQKKNFENTIFAIPAELLTRLGLDLAVLNPVRGTIEYELQQGKIMLKKFKDMYSKGRLSKFYLPNNGHQSYVDLDGNINMQVRMKQYNLIFKLAELFTVTVQGTIKKPTYTLQKQLRQEKNKNLYPSTQNS